MSDPAKYRTKEEVQAMREQRDCIELVRKVLTEEHAVTEDTLKAIEAEVRAIVQEAAQFAQDSPEPPESELWTDILVETR
jgi:pyruvate dehydrogenase E1 component alpha subunit